MAAGTLPAPGTRLGPCAELCEHRDCAETRRMAAALCSYCRKPIDYEVRFYDVRNEAQRMTGAEALVHARCHEEAIEAELKERHGG